MNTLTMKYIKHDGAISGLIDVMEAADNIVPISEYSILFETDDPVVAAKMKNNEKNIEKSKSGIGKIIDGIISIIRRFVDTIQEFFIHLTMGKNERSQFEAFKEQMAKNPSLRNKKITVKDFRKINKEYDSIMSEIDSEIKKCRAGEDHPVDALIHKCENILKNTASATATILTADAALKMAESDQIIAKEMQKTLKSEGKAMQQLKNTIGEKEFNKYKKRIDAAAKNTLLTRMKLKLLRRKYDNISSALNSTKDTFIHAGFANPFTWMGKVANKNEDTKRVVDFTKSTIKDSIKDTASNIIREKIPNPNKVPIEKQMERHREFLTGKNKPDKGQEIKQKFKKMKEAGKRILTTDIKDLRKKD